MDLVSETIFFLLAKTVVFHSSFELDFTTNLKIKTFELKYEGKFKKVFKKFFLKIRLLKNGNLENTVQIKNVPKCMNNWVMLDN